MKGSILGLVPGVSLGGADRGPSVKVACIFMWRECSLLYDTVAKRYHQALWLEWANSKTPPPTCLCSDITKDVDLCAFPPPIGTFCDHLKISSCCGGFSSAASTLSGA